MGVSVLYGGNGEERRNKIKKQKQTYGGLYRIGEIHPTDLHFLKLFSIVWNGYFKIFNVALWVVAL